MATIHDVAKKARVSISTVSRVLNGTAFVNNEIKKRVEDVIQELAYQPSPAARSRRVNHSHLIGLVISNIKQNIPVVSVNRRIRDKKIDAVLVDNLLGAREAIMHLLQNSYQRIGAITGPQTMATGRECLEGYRQALEEADISYDPSFIRSSACGRKSGYTFTQELLAITQKIDALFVGNNLIAMGALDAIQEQLRESSEAPGIYVAGNGVYSEANMQTLNQTQVK